MLLGSARSIVWLQDASVYLDGNACLTLGDTVLPSQMADGIEMDARRRLCSVQRSARISGHTLRVSAVSDGSLMSELRDSSAILAICVLLAVPMLLFIIWMFNRSVTMPVNALVGAAAHTD